MIDSISVLHPYTRILFYKIELHCKILIPEASAAAAAGRAVQVVAVAEEAGLGL